MINDYIKQHTRYLNYHLRYIYFHNNMIGSFFNKFIFSFNKFDNSSILLSSLLQSIGLQTRFVFVPGHVFVQVKLTEAISSYKDEQDWVNLDATCQGCKFGEIHYSYADSKKSYSG